MTYIASTGRLRSMTPWVVLTAAAASLLAAGPAGAVGLPAAGGVTAETVKLPDGPGSVRGLASDAAVSSFTGQVSYQIPIALPGGQGGLAPRLALGYDGALGNGPLGIGWSLFQASVRRSLRLGVPSYSDSDELELVGLPGATLVPIGNGQYRAEGQGNAIRGAAVDGGFELIDGTGTRFRLGTSDASRLQSGSRVAEWMIERITDVAGHVIDYSYERRDGELYLTAITWGGAGVYRADLSYEDRADAVVSWRTGFRVVAGRRLTAVQLSAFGVVRNTVVLTYGQPDPAFALSRLASVRVVGSDGTASPATTLSYASATPGQAQVLTNTGGWSLGTASVSFFDVDKDGAMDLLRVDSGSQRYRRNLGGSFGPEVALGNALAVTMSAVRMLDLDGDSGAEMVTKSGSTWRSFRIVNNAWAATDWPGSQALDLASVAVADLDGDNRMDVLASSGSGISVWFGTASGFAAPRTLPAISPNESSVKPTTVQFPDINGDGLADVVSVNSNGLLEFLGRGDGTFERVGLIAYPWPGTTDTTQLRLADLNRDGLLDLVRIGISQVFWYRGQPGGGFAANPVVLGRPPGADATTVVALADANGNGSTDVVWSSTSGMWALDLAGPTHAGLLVAIDNGLGKTQRFAYTASTQLAWTAESSGAAWTTRMPVSIAVTTTATQVLGSGDPDRTSLLGVRDGIYETAERRFIGFAQSVQTFPGSSAADAIQIVTQYHPGHGADRVLRGQVLVATTQDGAGNVFKRVDNQVGALVIDGLPDDPRLRRAAVTMTRTTYSEAGDAPAVVRTRYAFDGEGRLIEEARDGRVVDGVALDGDESIVRRTYTVEDPVTGVRDLVCQEELRDGAGGVVAQSQRLFGDDTGVAALCQPGKGWVREELGYLASEARWVSLKRTRYDAHGNPVLTDANGVQHAIGYDSHALHPVSESVSPAPGQTLTWTAQWDDAAGTLIKTVAPSGVETDLTYDGLGRMTSTAVNGGLPHVYYRYRWAGPRPATEMFTFDGDPGALGPLPAVWAPGSGWRHSVAVTTSAGERLLSAVQLDADRWNVGEHRRRDPRGRVIAITSPFDYQGSDVALAAPPAGAATQILTYDPLDRVTDQMLATGDHQRTVYHPLGATISGDGLAPLTTIVDGQGRTLHTERTVAGVVESVDAIYDPAGRIVQFSLQGGQVRHRFTYDSLGRLTSASDPDVGPRTMQYNDAGQLIAITNGAGELVSYGYDAAGRLAAVDGAGITTRYHYDVARAASFGRTGGQLAWVEEPTGSVDFGYDALGRLATQQRTITSGATTLTGSETVQLSPSGLALRVDLGDGVALAMRHDAAGRLTQIDGVWSVALYDAAGLPMREQFGNGVTQQYERDVLNRASRVTIGNAGGAFYDVAAAYNAFGAITTLTDRDGVGLDHTAQFGYDAAGRLTTAAIGSAPSAYQFSYSYDGLQNMTQRSASGPTELGILAGSYHYRGDAPRQLDHISGPGGATLASFAYDAAGRQVVHGDHQLRYDAASHLIRVDGPGGSVVHQYGYDGSRVATRGASGDTTYWITPNVVVHGSQRDHYVRVGERLIARLTTTAPDPAAAAAAVITRGRLGAAGLALLAMIALAGARGGARRRLAVVRPLRAVIASCLAVLAITSGCAGGASLAGRAAAVTGPAALYFHQTYAAGPELTSDGAGQLQEDRRTESFGAAIDAWRGGAVRPVDYRDNPINALNKFSDPDTSWSYHGARWFAPDTAQWHSPDPPATVPDPKFMLEPWGLNPYQYVNQNPVLYWDPDGRMPGDIPAEVAPAPVEPAVPTPSMMPSAAAPAAAEASTAAAPAAEAVEAGAGLGFGAFAAGLTAGAVVLLWPSSTASDDTCSRPGSCGQPPPEQSQPKPKLTVNLDTGAIINASQLDNMWANVGMRLYLADKRPVATVTAVMEYFMGRPGKGAAWDYAGPTERALAIQFLLGVQIVRDDPSARVLNIVPDSKRSAKALGVNDKVIFGTGDKNGWKTITVDGAFYYAAKNKGVDLNVEIFKKESYVGK